MNYLLICLKRQKKFFRIMRISFFIFTISLLHLSATVYSQNELFTIETKNATMRELFN